MKKTVHDLPAVAAEMLAGLRAGAELRGRILAGNRSSSAQRFLRRAVPACAGETAKLTSLLSVALRCVKGLPEHPTAYNAALPEISSLVRLLSLQFRYSSTAQPDTSSPVKPLL